MNSAIKILEKIGQNTSLKQHDDLLEMLTSLDVKENSFDSINLKENVCVLVPEDDESGDDDKTENT
ncbi:MAG: hypothetical protein JKY19_13120 [Alcanivoracaceae bacterium]|nr:hypothetical protein [Alcanivoracaceae bacterium]